MNVLESRAGRPLRLRPWVLAGRRGGGRRGRRRGARVATSGSTPEQPGPSSARADPAPARRAPVRASTASFFLKSTTPAAGTQNVAANTQHLAAVLGPGLAEESGADADTRHRRQVGPDERHHADLRPRLPPHPLLPGRGDHPRRDERPALDGRGHAALLALGRLRRGGRRHPPAPAAPGPAQLPAGRLRPQRPGAHQCGPGRGPGGHLLLALAQSADAAHLAVDPGHHEPDHQGRRRGLRDPEQHRRGRDPRPHRVDLAAQRRHQQQAERDALRLRPREQSGPPNTDALEQRGGPVHRPDQQRGARAPTPPTAPSPSSSTCATRK